MIRIALFTIAVGKDPIYFDSVKRYFPYNKKYFGQENSVDYFLFTDQKRHIEDITNIDIETSYWPYVTLLKNNMISDYLNTGNKWNDYDYVFFIDADFALGDFYDFFSHDFLLIEPYWNDSLGGGGFYGGKSHNFKLLCNLFYEEIKFISENKLPVPRDLDEYYLGLYRQETQDDIHIIKMETNTNTLIFNDNENLDEKIKEQGCRLFMIPYKSEGRANKTLVKNFLTNKIMECIVNIEEKYIFDNYTYDFGRLLPIDENSYRILWSKVPESREIFNTKDNSIRRRFI